MSWRWSMGLGTNSLSGRVSTAAEQCGLSAPAGLNHGRSASFGCRARREHHRFDSAQRKVSAINRNFPDRSGSGQVWLASPPTVVASAMAGRLVSFEELRALASGARQSP